MSFNNTSSVLLLESSLKLKESLFATKLRPTAREAVPNPTRDDGIACQYRREEIATRSFGGHRWRSLLDQKLWHGSELRRLATLPRLEAAVDRTGRAKSSISPGVEVPPTGVTSNEFNRVIGLAPAIQRWLDRSSNRSTRQKTPVFVSRKSSAKIRRVKVCPRKHSTKPDYHR